jgi:hypothetical protein
MNLMRQTKIMTGHGKWELFLVSSIPKKLKCFGIKSVCCAILKNICETHQCAPTETRNMRLLQWHLHPDSNLGQTYIAVVFALVTYNSFKVVIFTVLSIIHNSILFKLQPDSICKKLYYMVLEIKINPYSWYTILKYPTSKIKQLNYSNMVAIQSFEMGEKL